ncbi:uncharacterized protein [Equus caballus]|uniref:uncharacterized protein n=1 Tax=Equus caballus TaxID=9796 RepID=UPI0038B33F7D
MPEWVKVAARQLLSPGGRPHLHSAGRAPESVKVAARRAAQPWAPPPPPLSRQTPEWVKVAARRAAQPWGPPPPLLSRPNATVGESGSPPSCSAPGANPRLSRPTAIVCKSGSPPRCSPLGDPLHSPGRPPEWVKVAARSAAQPWGAPTTPLRRPTARVGESGIPPSCSALGPPPTPAQAADHQSG